MWLLNFNPINTIQNQYLSEQTNCRHFIFNGRTTGFRQCKGFNLFKLSLCVDLGEGNATLGNPMNGTVEKLSGNVTEVCEECETVILVCNTKL